MKGCIDPRGCGRSEAEGAVIKGRSTLCEACKEAIAEAEADDAAKLEEARRLVAAAPHRFMVEKGEPSRVKYGEEDLAHCALCGQAEDRPVHRMAARSSSAREAQ